MELVEKEIVEGWVYDPEGLWMLEEKGYRCCLYRHERIAESWYVAAGVDYEGKKYSTSLKVRNDDEEGLEVLLRKVERALDRLVDEQL